MRKVAVVILNYLNYKDTIECIESLMKDTYKNKEIIVVDNASRNESIKILSNYITNSNIKIHFLINETNEGYAKGNNLGILFARDVLNCEFILIVNNDTVFIDEKFIFKLIASYEKGIAIIGPRIIAQNGYEQNPVGNMKLKNNDDRAKVFIKEKIKHIIQKNKKIESMFNKYKKYKKILTNEFLSRKKTSDILVLHGACMLLTPEYFKYYPFLYPKTFLYYEENILTIITHKVGLKKKFIANAKILHKEDQSSLLSFNNDKKIFNQYQNESIVLANKLVDMDYKAIINEFKN